MKKFIWFSLLILIMSACQKELSSEDTTPGNPDPNPASEPLLKRYIRVDTTLAPPNDTIMVADFYYDNLKRCNRINFRVTDTNGNIRISDSTQELRFYNGNDTLLSHRFYVSTNPLSGADTMKEYFRYDAQGRVITDSVYEQNWGVFNYRYAGNKVYSTAFFNTQDTFLYSIHDITKVNNNIVLEKTQSTSGITFHGGLQHLPVVIFNTIIILTHYTKQQFPGLYYLKPNIYCRRNIPHNNQIILPAVQWTGQHGQNLNFTPTNIHIWLMDIHLLQGFIMYRLMNIGK